MHPSMHTQRRETAALGWLGHTTDTRFLWSGSRSRSRSFHAHASRALLLLACCTDTRIHTWHAAVREAWEPDCARK